MKKGLALLLALVLCISCVSALADVDLTKYVSNPDEKITIAWLAGHDTDAVAEGDTVVAWLEEKFNVDLDVWFIERENYDELLTARIAGGEVPDVFMLQNAQQFAKWVKQEVAMELPLEVIQQCMPESYAWLIEYDPDCFSNVSYNGKNYGLPRVNGDGYFNYAPFWRADWLAKFGYTDGKVPMTLEECEEVFYKFANEDPDGNGEKDTYALSNTGMNPIFGAFGALPDRWVDDGEGNLVFGAVYPGMKDALTLLAKWYADKLIDPEFITGENQGGYWALSVPFENGQIGFSSSGAYYHLAPDFDGPKNEETGEGGNFQYGRTMRTFAATEGLGYDKMIIGYNPTGPDGKQGGESWGLTTSEAIVFSYKLADQPAKVARILEIINTIGSDFDTWLKIWNWDLESDQYDYDDLLGYIAKEGHERADEGSHTNMFNTLQNPYFAMKVKPAQWNWGKTLPQFRTGGYSNTLLPITTASQPAHWEDMEKLRLGTYVQIITGEKPVDAFDDFVKQWNEMGGAKITEEANEWYHSR
jgi:putative aldouronate transport system substrate-binding protein